MVSLLLPHFLPFPVAANISSDLRQISLQQMMLMPKDMQGIMTGSDKMLTSGVGRSRIRKEQKQMVILLSRGTGAMSVKSSLQSSTRKG